MRDLVAMIATIVICGLVLQVAWAEYKAVRK